MCGIAGILHSHQFAKRCDRRVDEENNAQEMLAAIVHRGPDDGGLLIAPPIYLGHRRLAILDTSSGGHQPMRDPSGRYWLSYNGEIYNYRGLREELVSAGAVFHTRSDTEVLLQAILHWGRGVLNRLDGMFAFALWDRREESLWLARDPFGIKPLFFSVDRDRFVFGSEIKALLAAGVPAIPDHNALSHFLTFGYSIAPETGFDGIRQLEPGHELSIRASDLQPSINRWYQLPYPSSPCQWSRQESADRLHSALSKSVALQSQSDVPLGAFLSGGLDSTAVVCCMAQQSQYPVQTFTVGFDESTFDESTAAKAVAEVFHTQHHAPRVHASHLDSLIDIVHHAEDPIADNSLLAFWSLCQATSKHVKVALSGDGADELLGGYSTYRASELAKRYRAIPAWVRHNLIQAAALRLPTSERKYSASMLAKRFVREAERAWPLDHCSWRLMIDRQVASRIRIGAWEEGMELALQRYAAALESAPPWLSPLETMLHLDLNFHLPNDMLVKVDRMSMAHALEARVPFLGNDVVATCLAIPPRWKRHGNLGKIALRDALRNEVPKRILGRKKAGFVIPIEAWLRGPWRDAVRDRLTPEFCEMTGMLDGHAMQTLLLEHASKQQDHSYAIFTLLVFSVWWDAWITHRGSGVLRDWSHRAVPSQITRLEPFDGAPLVC